MTDPPKKIKPIAFLAPFKTIGTDTEKSAIGYAYVIVY